MYSSVMDYTSANIGPDPKHHGQYYSTVPGPYDIWAIEYGYTPSLENPEDEKDRVKTLLNKSTKNEYGFGNDADDMRSPGRGIDPRIMVNDMSSDPVGYAQQRMDIIKAELLEIRDLYGDERRTEVIPVDADFSMEDMIAEEEVVLTITHQGYIKRTALNTYRTQRRGGRGIQGAMSKDEDFVEHLFIANTHNYMLFFTDRGKCHWLKVYDIPQGGRATRGRAIVNLIGCEPGEKVEAFVSVKNFDDDHYIVMATQKGIVKKTVLSAYGKPRKGGIYAIEIREGDKLIEARITNGEHDILLGTYEGKSIRFSENNIRPSGRKTMGVKGIKLGSKDDYVVGMLVVRREGTILVATEKGMGKRTDVIQYRTQTRGGKGVMTMRCTEKTGKMVNIMEVVDSDDLIIITESGVLMRQPVADIRTIGRVTQGVKLVKLDEGTSISSITRVISEDAAAKEPEPEDRQLMIKDTDQQNEEE